MSNFYEKLDKYYSSNATDIKVVVRQCWHFSFTDYEVRVWQGKGKLHTEDGNEWLGYIDNNGGRIINTPKILDGRDGTSPTYEFTMKLVDLPGTTAFEAYEKLKRFQNQVFGRPIVAWLALLEVGEGLRPNTPLEFYQELTMQSTRFNESLSIDNNSLRKNYSITVIAKDGNFGRSSIPGGTYTSTVQKSRAAQFGVPIDKGCDFVLGLSDRTYQHP
jgi:hypothetical protein